MYNKKLHFFSAPFCTLVLCAIFSKNQVTSFVVSQPFTKSTYLSSLPSSDDSAKAMQDYMIKAHEEKLRALKELEDAKNKEIAELKNQLNNNAGSSALAIPTSTSGDDIQELKGQILYYQEFMSNYIVKSQEEKYRAVKEAENKYKQKLLALSGSSSSASASTTSTPSAPPAAKELISLPESSKLYQGRSVKVASAGAKGKSSRWGDAEVHKSQSIANGVENVLKKVAPSPPVIEISPQIIAADHGLHRDGDLSLAERIGQGSASSLENVLKKVAPLPAAIEVSPQTVAADAPSPAAIEVSPQIVAADHGLHRDGDLSLAERVVLGSQASTGAKPNPVASSLAARLSVFEQRNQKVVNAGKANKSHRWGDLEVAKVTTHMEQLPQGSISNRVEENDSIAVNIGAKFLAL